MDVENIFRDVKLSKTEMTVLRFIQNDPEQCIRQGVRAVAEQCYSNPSSLVRLAKKLKFSGWLELSISSSSISPCRSSMSPTISTT